MLKPIIMLIASLGLCSLAHAEWRQSEIKDEMRGQKTNVFSLTENPTAGSGPSLTLSVVDRGDGHPGVVFRLDQSRVQHCPNPEGGFCEASVKFNSGEVLKPSFASDDGVSLIPTQSVAFVGTLLESETVFFEADIRGIGVRQYKFAVAGLQVAVDRSPTISVHGFELGSRYPGPKTGLERKGGEGDDACYVVSDQSDVLGISRAAKASLCFYRDVFYLALVTPGNKAAYDAGKSYLTSSFGRPDPDSMYPSWPDDHDKVIQTNTKKAAYPTFGKNTYKYPFIISDEIISPLVPKQN